MGSWITYTLLAILILGLGACIYMLLRREQEQADKWKRIADQKYKEGRSEASQILRAAVDQIADDKLRMAELSDRELLTEALLGLAGLGRRMDRMEDSLKAVTRMDDLLDSVNAQAELLSQNAGILGQQVIQIQDAAATFQSAVAGTGEAVYSLSDSTHSIEQLLEDVSGQLKTLQSFSDSFSELQVQMERVLARVNQNLRASGENPAALLSQLDSRVGAMQNQLQNLSEGLNLMAQSLEGVQDTLDSVNDRTRMFRSELRNSAASE